MVGCHKVRLLPNKRQESLFIKFSNVSRYIYNYTLGLKIKEYEECGESLNLSDLLKRVRYLKYSEGFEWLLEVPEAVQKQAVKDMLSAYKGFFSSGKGFPKFKSKRRSKLSFYQRTDKIRKIDSSHIKITGIKEPVKVAEEILDGGFLNPRVSFDGKYWYLTYSVEIPNDEYKDLQGTIGIDLGVSNLAVCSNGMVFRNINKDIKVLKIEKRKKRLQRKVSRKYQMNKEGTKFIKTNNIEKLERKIRILDRKLKNIRETYLHEVTSSLVKTKPEKIVVEDLDVSSMLKNKYLSSSISKCCFYKFRQFLSYKCEYRGIRLIIADRYYKSTKICSKCGSVKKTITLSDRTYHCSNCGLIIDRDYNASLNLVNYCS